jgi:hypothetical protein
VNQKPASKLNLEQSHKSAEEKEIGLRRLGETQGEQKKGVLRLLRKTKEKVHEGVRKVKRALSTSGDKH